MTIGYVSQELYGVWLTLSSIIGWMGFMDIGFTQGLKNRLAEAIACGEWEKGKSLVSTTYFMMLLIFIPVAIILEVISPFINWCDLLNIDYKYQDIIVKTIGVLLLFYSIQMFVNVIVSVAAAFQKVALSNSFNVIGNILSLLVIFVLTKTTRSSLINLCFSITAMPLLAAIIGSIILYYKEFKKVRPSIDSIRISLCKDLFGLGYKFFIINMQVLVLFQTTNILISNLSSPIMVTSYNIAYKYLNIAMMVFSIIMAPLWPAYTEAYTLKDYSWMRRTKNKMNRILLLSMVCCLAMALFSPLSYKIWLGNKVDVPFEMTWLVTLYVIINCWVNLNGTMIVGIGKITLESIVSIVGMSLHIPLSLYLSKYLGAYGVLVSMISINLFYGLIFNIQVKKLLNDRAYGIWNK